MPSHLIRLALCLPLALTACMAPTRAFDALRDLSILSLIVGILS